MIPMRPCRSKFSCVYVVHQVLPQLQDMFVPNRKKGLKRRFRIRRCVELVRYGYTEGCLGCSAAEKGLTAVAHSEKCRERIKARLLEDEVSASIIRKTREGRGRGGHQSDVDSSNAVRGNPESDSANVPLASRKRRRSCATIKRACRAE